MPVVSRLCVRWDACLLLPLSLHSQASFPHEHTMAAVILGAVPHCTEEEELSLLVLDQISWPCVDHVLTLSQHRTRASRTLHCEITAIVSPPGKQVIKDGLELLTPFHTRSK